MNNAEWNTPFCIIVFLIKDYPIQPFIVHSYLWRTILGEVVSEGATLNTGHGEDDALAVQLHQYAVA